MTTEESREVAEARAALRDLLDDGGYGDADIDRLVAAVRKDERERIDFDLRDKATILALHYNRDIRISGMVMDIRPFTQAVAYIIAKWAAPAEGGTEG